ncbi:MAG TPA: hypothetical protein DCF33_13195, partial [Saprospirales bacterium]|nr:hypothetical protein [Saprospirales bacterium]
MKYLSFLFLFAIGSLTAQPAPSLQLLTTADGLSQGMVLDIIQSRDGFMWIATKDGLNRYDGSRFKVFSPNPFDPFAIGGSVVQNLYEDSRGWIWISQPENLDVLDPVSGRFFHLMHEGKPIGNSFGAGFMETPDGVLWLWDDDRIWKTSPTKDMLVKAARQGVANIELPCKAISLSAVSGWSGGPLQVRQLHYSQEKKLLVCTNHGLFRIDPATEQIVPEMSIPDNYIQSLTESKSGELLLNGIQGSHSYLTLISNGKVLYKIEDSPRGLLSKFVFDDAGCLWAYNSTNRSIQKWRPSMLFNDGMPELEIPSSVLRLEKNYGYGCISTMVDKSGNVWVGTSGYGIVKINKTGQKFKTSLPRTAHEIFYEDPNGALYTGAIPDKKFLSNSFDHSAPNTDLPMIKDREQRCVTFDPAGNAW